ncbi:MAG: DUF5804 family protein [Haloarculaceae archaeon]
MTRVCLVGAPEVNLQYELLSRETAREALATYDIHEPFHNSLGVETVSLGAAVALLNDLDWYLVRFVDEAMVLEPSVDGSEWLSRDLATAIRDDELDRESSDRFLKIYGLESVDSAGEPDREGAADETDRQGRVGTEQAAPAAAGDDGPGGSAGEGDGPMRLVEPMYVTRTGGSVPSYDLRDVDETLVERVTESEFGA